MLEYSQHLAYCRLMYSVRCAGAGGKGGEEAVERIHQRQPALEAPRRRHRFRLPLPLPPLSGRPSTTGRGDQHMMLHKCQHCCLLHGLLRGASTWMSNCHAVTACRSSQVPTSVSQSRLLWEITGLRTKLPLHSCQGAESAAWALKFGLVALNPDPAADKHVYRRTAHASLMIFN